jgi:catechol 2,3-dioxygenase-like lactoylglutathione lyase family enzyme
MLTLRVKRPSAGGFSREHTVHQVLSLSKGLITDIRGYSTRGEEESPTVGGLSDVPGITARQVIPILNVSSLARSFDWFGKLGWHKKWDWRDPAATPSFGAVGSGDCEIFLSLNGQGGRGNDDGVGGAGMWISVWIDDVDRAYAVCRREGIEVIRPPHDELWGVREMHVRHPDGHVFRISQASHSH